MHTHKLKTVSGSAMFMFNGKSYQCPFDCFSEITKGKWRSGIIVLLKKEPLRFSELRKNLEGISAKVLSDNLKLLESCGIISRKVFDTLPPSVEYRLTEQGTELAELMDNINRWTHRFAGEKTLSTAE